MVGRDSLPTLHVRPLALARRAERASSEYVSSARVPRPSRSARALPQARLWMMTDSCPQKMAAQCGMGRMHELTRVLRATGHCSRLPRMVLDLAQ